MTALLTGLASLLVFGSVILVHELGHFMAARHCGIHVEEFSIGFGPRLWSTTRDGTTYSVRLLPLGGYNLFSSLPDEEDDESGESAPPPAPKPRKTTLFPLVVSGQKFEDATAWQRFFVTLCGALMNFILGVAVLLVLVLTMGKVGSTTIADFSENATSSAALQEGDTILQICSNPCWTVYDITDWFYTAEEETYNVVVLRGSEVLELQGVTFTPTRDADGNVLYGMDGRSDPPTQGTAACSRPAPGWAAGLFWAAFLTCSPARWAWRNCPAPSARCRRSTRPCTTAGGRYCPCWLC